MSVIDAQNNFISLGVAERYKGYYIGLDFRDPNCADDGRCVVFRLGDTEPVWDDCFKNFEEAKEKIDLVEGML